jgi:hypothetical protein
MAEIEKVAGQVLYRTLAGALPIWISLIDGSGSNLTADPATTVTVAVASQDTGGIHG